MKDQTQTGDTQLEESFYKWISAQIHLLHLAIPMFLFSPIATVKHKTTFNLVSEHSIYSVLYHPICLLYQRCAAVTSWFSVVVLVPSTRLWTPCRLKVNLLLLLKMAGGAEI